MKQTRHKLTTSQQSPRGYYHDSYRTESLNSNMFLEDFCQSFSIKLAPFEQHNNFFDVEPYNDLLRNLITFENCFFFEYQFDQILNTIMHYLIMNGTAHLEIVRWTDEKGMLQGIELVPICVSKYIKTNKAYYFFAKTYDRQNYIKFRVDKQSIISFKLKDLNFNPRYFRHLIKNLSRFDVLGKTDLVFDKMLNGIYDFNEHQKQQDFQLLKCTRKIFWHGRSFSNQFLSDSYLLYREAHGKILQYDFLDYILKKINDGLTPLKEKFSFEGNIVTTAPRINYSQCFSEYYDGKINISQLGDIVLYNKFEKICKES